MDLGSGGRGEGKQRWLLNSQALLFYVGFSTEKQKCGKATHFSAGGQDLGMRLGEGGTSYSRVNGMHDS